MANCSLSALVGAPRDDDDMGSIDIELIVCMLLLLLFLLVVAREEAALLFRVGVDDDAKVTSF